jgi:hypothetical protein
MGYRSTFVTEDIYYELPEWFIEKYQDQINFSEKKLEGYDKLTFPLSSKYERKFYSGAEDELFVDLAKMLQQVTESYPRDITIALMHEDGEIDRVIITPEKVTIQRSLENTGGYNPQLGSGNDEFIVNKEPTT